MSEVECWSFWKVTVDYGGWANYQAALLRGCCSSSGCSSVGVDSLCGWDCSGDPDVSSLGLGLSFAGSGASVSSPAGGLSLFMVWIGSLGAGGGSVVATVTMTVRVASARMEPSASMTR